MKTLEALTLGEVLSSAEGYGVTPEETAIGVQRWRTAALAYGEKKLADDPEHFWKTSNVLNDQVDAALAGLRDKAGMEVLKQTIPAEQIPDFFTKYKEAGGDPTKMVDDQWMTAAETLGKISTSPEFRIEKTQPVSLEADGKPLADLSMQSTDEGWKALVRPLKEGGKPFTLDLTRYTPEQMSTIAAEETARADQLELEAKTPSTHTFTDPALEATVKDEFVRRSEESRSKAQIFGTGDPRVIAGFEASQKIKENDDQLSQIADKSLWDRFKSGAITSSINTARAVAMAGQAGIGSKPTDPFAGTEEALSTISADTARSFVPNKVDQTLASTAESMGQMSTTLLPAGGALRLLKAAGVAGATLSEAAAAGTMAPSSAGGEYADMLARAKTAREAGDETTARKLEGASRWSAIAQGLIDTGTEMIFPEASGMFKGFTGPGDFIKKAITTGAKGATEEMAAGLLERGAKQPLFYPKDQQQPLLQGLDIEAAAGALAEGGMVAVPAASQLTGKMVRAVAASKTGARIIARADGAAVSAAPDPGTAAQVSAIMTNAEKLRAFTDLDTEEPVTPPEEPVTPPEEPVTPPVTPTTPTNEEEEERQRLERQGQQGDLSRLGLNESPPTTTPTPEGSVLGGGIDLGTSPVEGLATGSTAPGVSPTGSVSTDVNPVVNPENFGPVYHTTDAEFDTFDLSKANPNAVLGPAIYASTSEGNLWSPPGRNNRTITGKVSGKVIDLTEPLSPENEKTFSDLLGRPIKESVPLISLEKRFGSVAAGLKAAGFSAALHMGPGATGKHIAVFSPESFIPINTPPVTTADLARSNVGAGTNIDLQAFKQKVQAQPTTPDDTSSQSVPLPVEPPATPLDPQAAANYLRAVHGLGPANVTIVNKPELRARGVLIKGRPVLNAAWIGSLHELDEVLYHEVGHRVENDPAIRPDISAVMGTLTPAELDTLDARLAKNYTLSEFPSERAAITLSEMANRFRKLPAFQRIVQRVKTWFKQNFNRPLGQKDAEAIASRIVAKAIRQLRSGKAMVTTRDTGNVRRSAVEGTPESVRHAALEAKAKAGTITPAETAEAQRMVDERAKAAGYDVGVAEHRTTSDTLEGNTFDLSRAGSSGGGRIDFHRPAIWFAITSQKTRDLIDLLAKKGFPPPYGGKVIRAYLKIEDGVDFDQTEKNGTRILGVTDPSRIKSAEPFTGVPLDQRFNPESPDIRYSRPEGTPESVRHAALEAKAKAGTITPAETAEAQRLVDEAARVAGYITKLLYHYRDSQIPFNQIQKDIDITDAVRKEKGSKDHPLGYDPSSTAISRKAESSIVSLIKEDGLITKTDRVLHAGAGRKNNPDRNALDDIAGRVKHYDPGVLEDSNRAGIGSGQYDKVVSPFVLNVLSAEDRPAAIRDIVTSLKPGGSAIIGVRGASDVPSVDDEARMKTGWTPYSDGWLVPKSGWFTFQRGFTAEQLKVELESYFGSVEIIRGGAAPVVVASTPKQNASFIPRSVGKGVRNDFGDFGNGIYLTPIPTLEGAKRQQWWPTTLEGKYREKVYTKIEQPFYDSVYNAGFIRDRPGDAVLAMPEYANLEKIRERGDKVEDQITSAKEIMVRHASQIKSAEPFTGVPLDQRFNPESPDIRYSRPEGTPERAQVFGEENVGQIKPKRSVAISTATAKATYFDGSQPITEEASTDAMLKALEWSDPNRGNAVAGNLLADNNGDELIVAIAQGELYQYAQRLAASGDSSLLSHMRANSNLWRVAAGGEGGVSSYAATLAGRSVYPQSASMEAMTLTNLDRTKAATTNISGEIIDATTVAVNGTKLEPGQIESIKTDVKDEKGETLEEKVKKRTRKKKAATPAEGAENVEEEPPPEPENIEEEPPDELSEEDKSATRYVDRVDKSQVEILMPESIPDPILKYIREQETSNVTTSKDRFTAMVRAGLENLGVSPDLAINTAERVWLRKEAIRDSKVRRTQKDREDVTKAAQSFIDQWDTSQTETRIPEKEKNPALQILKGAVSSTQPVTKEVFIQNVISRLLETGVTRSVATNAAERAWAARQTNQANRTRQLAERKAKREAERKAKREAERKSTAERILDQFAKAQSDTPSLTDSQKDPVRDLIREAMKPESMFDKAGLIDALQKEGVDPVLAARLTDVVWTQRQSNAQIDAALKARDLALGERGILKPLEDMLAAAPAPQQQSPQWRQKAAETYFQQLGLSPNQAKAAARLYNDEFAARLQDALEAAFGRVVNRNAPWQKKLKDVNETKKRKIKTDMDRLRTAIRLGVTDPNVLWQDELAKANGWKGFTSAQHARMAELDHLLTLPEVPTYKKKAHLSEIQDIVARANVPPKVGNYIVSSYTISALTGIPTLMVQLSSAIALVRNYVTDIFTDPGNAIIATKAMRASLDAMVKEFKYAMETNVFNHQVAEHLHESVPVLQLFFEKGVANWTSNDPYTKAKGALQIIVGAQEFFGKTLNSMDQGSIGAGELYSQSLFTVRSRKALGWTREQAAAVVTASLDARQDAFDNARDAGLSWGEAGVAANETFRNQVHGHVAQADPEIAEDIGKASTAEALSNVGRMVPGFRNMDEGMLSRWTQITRILDSLNQSYREGGANALGARIMFGFISIPFRTARYFAGYSPYGLVRYAIHRNLVGRGKETYWKQSMGTRMQERQRLREAIAGTVLMGIFWALSGKSGDDDPEKSDILKFIVTGRGPEDPATRKIWEKRFSPYSLTVKVGRHYFKMNLGRAFESIAWPLAFAGALDDLNQAQKGAKAKAPNRTFDALSFIVGSYLGSLTQRSAFQGIGKVSSSFSRGGSGQIASEVGRQVVFAASAFIPWKSAMQSLTRLFSTPVDDSTLKGVIYANTPIIGPMLGKPGLNALGDPLGDNTLAGKLYREGLPVVVRFPTDDKSRKVYDLILEKGKGPSVPRRADVEKVYGTVDDETFYQYRKTRGQMIKQKMLKNYQALKDMDLEDYTKEMTWMAQDTNPEAAKAVGLVKGRPPSAKSTGY